MTFKYLIYDEEDEDLEKLIKIYKKMKKANLTKTNPKKAVSRIYDDLKFTDLLNLPMQNIKSQNNEEVNSNLKIIRETKFSK